MPRSFAGLLQRPGFFPIDYLAAVGAAEEAGDLEETFSRLATQAAERLYTRLAAFSAIAHRIVAYVCGLYLALQVYTVVMLLAARR